MKSRRGSLRKIAPEGVRCIQGRWIANGWHRLEEKLRERGRGWRAAGGEEGGGGLHGRGEQGRRRNPIGRYGARFSTPKTPGEGEGQRDSNQALCAAGGRPKRPAPWPAATNYSGERGRGARVPRIARQKDGEGAGKETKLTTARIRSENGSKRRDDTRRRLLLRRQFSA